MNRIEWIGCITGLFGSILVAFNSATYSKWGFVAFLASNLLWIFFGLSKKLYPLVVMQMGFTVTSLIGITQWFALS